MGSTLIGLDSWSGHRDSNGHRNYKLKWLVEVDDPYVDGPGVASNAVGLAAIGSSFVIGNESDVAAICRPETDITMVYTGEPCPWFWVTQTFSSKPLGNWENRDDVGSNPLLWPPEISGGFVKYSKEATTDRDGFSITSSSHERFKGATVERDFSRHQVSIKMYLATLPLTAYAAVIDNVNSVSMWGLAAGKVKLSNVSWKIHYYGVSYASRYYEVTYDFDIYPEGFALNILDEGTKKLKSGGNANNPADFEPYLLKGQPATALLNGSGVPITNVADVTYRVFDVYQESNLLLLGVPTSL